MKIFKNPSKLINKRKNYIQILATSIALLLLTPVAGNSAEAKTEIVPTSPIMFPTDDVPLIRTPTQKYFCPLSNCKVAKPFKPGENNWDPGHRGVDLYGLPGAQVFSPESGTVYYVGKIADRTVLSIEHSDGKRSTFEPIETSLEKGQHVEKGEVIGTLLPFHCFPSTCLHWGVKTDIDSYLNPMSFVRGKRVWLLK